MKQYNRVYAKINLDAISYNMEQMEQRLGGDTQLIAVVKTDGYGHGAIPIAELLEQIDYVWGMQLQAWMKQWCFGRLGLKNQFLC